MLNTKNPINNPPLHNVMDSKFFFLEEYTSAYILVRLESVPEKSIRSSIAKIDDVKCIDFLLGPSDLIVYLEASSLDKLRKSISTMSNVFFERKLPHRQNIELVLQDSFGKGYSMRKKSKYGAWALININSSDPHVVLNEIKEISLVSNAHCVLGDYDIIAHLESESIPSLIECIDFKFNKIDGVSTIDTRMVISIN